MTLERFADLAEAYGGDLRRWPAEARAAAQALLACDPAAAGVLAQAADMDRWLDAYAATAPGPALRNRILAQAPRNRTRGRGIMAWWVAGAASVAAAGAVAGAALIVVAPSPARDPGSGGVYDQATAFGDLNANQDS